MTSSNSTVENINNCLENSAKMEIPKQSDANNSINKRRQYAPHVSSVVVVFFFVIAIAIAIAIAASSSVGASHLHSHRPSVLPLELMAPSIYDFTVKDIKGNDVSLGMYKGKVLLIVNVASQCGLTTSNYKDLTDLYTKYKDAGLEILAFPCNQFRGQEPGTNDEIQEFACTRFKAEFPIFDKVDVNGAKAAPLYQFLKKAKGGGIFGDFIKWNFTKFLVDREGEVVQRFAPTTAPSKIEVDIKKLLGVS